MVYSVSVSFSIFRVQQYTRSTAIIHNINIDHQGVWVPTIKIFANQFKSTKGTNLKVQLIGKNFN